MLGRGGVRGHITGMLMDTHVVIPTTTDQAACVDDIDRHTIVADVLLALPDSILENSSTIWVTESEST